MRLQFKELLISALVIFATGCGQPNGQSQGLQGDVTLQEENRCPIVTETRTTAEADLLVANSVKARITSPATQNYLRQTMQAHYGHIVRVSQIVSKNTMSPIDSKQAQALREAAPAEANELKTLSGVQLERAYLDWQISMFEQTLATMDSRWLKMASTPDLVAFLHDFQAFATERLEAARAVRASL